MGVKEDLQNLENQIKQYREQLYSRYNELLQKFASKSRIIIQEFKNYIEKPTFKIGDVLGKKYLIPDVTLDTVREPTIKWTGDTRYYRITPEEGKRGSTVREYELIAMPVFEFDPVSDKQVIEAWIKKKNVLVFADNIYVKADKDVPEHTTFEDAINKYFFCNEIWDMGRLVDDYNPPDTAQVWALYHDGTLYRLKRVPKGTRIIKLYNSSYDDIAMDVFLGELEFYRPDTDKSWLEDAVYIELYELWSRFGDKAVWMFGNKELRRLFLILRKGGMGWDVFTLMFKHEAEELASRIQTVQEWIQVHPCSLASSLLRAYTLAQLRKVRSLG